MSNERQVLLGGIRLGGSATSTQLLSVSPSVVRNGLPRSLPVASRYYRTMLEVSVPTENLITPT